MFVSDWMTKKVFTVCPDDSVSDALKLMKEKKIKHLPVVKDCKIKGIISDRDIKEFTPSAATTLDVYELHYLLAKAKVKDIMKTKVLTTGPETPVEEAAMILYDNGIGCLPVEENGALAGIISDKDIFCVLVDITGIRHGGHRISFMIEDRPGSIKEVADIIRKHGFSLQGVLTSYERVKSGHRNIVIRTNMAGSFKPLKAELESAYKNVRITKG
ncbi:MAG: CBS domain-containing protein [Nitrospirae bacterium]|nr:MAG: CBS domain-containing protein [Nitrospirota bacterium]